MAKKAKLSREAVTTKRGAQYRLYLIDTGVSSGPPTEESYKEVAKNIQVELSPLDSIDTADYVVIEVVGASFEQLNSLRDRVNRMKYENSDENGNKSFTHLTRYDVEPQVVDLNDMSVVVACLGRIDSAAKIDAIKTDFDKHLHHYIPIQA